MDKREISESEVIETMANPDSVEGGKFDRKIAPKRYGRYLLRVIFEEYKEHALLITAYPARAERYLRG